MAWLFVPVRRVGVLLQIYFSHTNISRVCRAAGQRKHIQLEAVVWAKNVSSMAEVKEEWPGSFELKGSLQPRCAEEVLWMDDTSNLRADGLQHPAKTTPGANPVRSEQEAEVTASSAKLGNWRLEKLGLRRLDSQMVGSEGCMNKCKYGWWWCSGVWDVFLS